MSEFEITLHNAFYHTWRFVFFPPYLFFQFRWNEWRLKLDKPGKLIFPKTAKKVIIRFV